MSILTDPRFAAIYAAAGAAAQASAPLNPKIAMAQATLSTILEAAAAFQAGLAAGDFTDADMVAAIDKLEANLDGAKADLAAQGGAAG